MENSSALELSVSLSFSERLRAAIAVSTGSVSTMIWLGLFPIFGLLLVAVNGSDPGWFDVLMTILCFGFVPAILVIGAYRGSVAARKSGPFVYRLTPEGIELKTPTAELKQSWAGIPRVRTSQRFLLVYSNKKCAYPFPFRMVTPEQVHAVLAWAKSGGTERVGA